MNSSILILIWALLVGLVAESKAMSVVSWCFSAPVVFGKRLIFADPQRKHVICVDRDNGDVLWKSRSPDGEGELFALGSKIFFAATKAVHEINIENGRFRRLIQTKFPMARILRMEKDSILIESVGEGDAWDPGVWSVSRKTGRTRWKCEQADLCLAIGSNVLFFSTNPWGQSDVKLGALDLKTGKVLWSEKGDGHLTEAFALGDYFFAGPNLDDEFFLYDQRSGKKQSRLLPEGGSILREDIDGNSATIELQFWPDGETLKTVVRSYELPRFDGRVVAEIEGQVWPRLIRDGIQIWVPIGDEKERGRIQCYDAASKKNLWSGDWGDSVWSGVHGGWIYPSISEADGTSTVNAIELKTGERRVLLRSQRRP